VTSRPFVLPFPFAFQGLTPSPPLPSLLPTPLSQVFAKLPPAAHGLRAVPARAAPLGPLRPGLADARPGARGRCFSRADKGSSCRWDCVRRDSRSRDAVLKCDFCSLPCVFCKCGTRLSLSVHSERKDSSRTSDYNWGESGRLVVLRSAWASSPGTQRSWSGRRRAA